MTIFKQITLLLCGVFLIKPVVAQDPVLKKTIPDKVVVLTFDDAVVSHATYVAPLLKKYGFGATFYIAEFSEPPFSDTTLYMTWEQIRALNQMGFEVGNHTGHHTHVDRIDAKELAQELIYIEEKGIRLGIPRPLTFAYPAYRTAPYVLEVLEERDYIFARIGGDRPYNPETDHPYLIPSYTMLTDNRELMFEAFDQATGGQIVVLTIHGVPDTAHPWVDTPPALFEEYMHYLHSHDYQVLSMRDLAQFIDVEQARNTLAPQFD